MHPKDEDISKLWTLDASVYTTSLFELPGGGVGFAFGGQFRRESLKETPDMLNVEGDIVGNSPVPPANGGRKSYSFYAEARIPIFGPDNAIPGFHSLEFEDGIRFEEFLNNRQQCAGAEVRHALATIRRAANPACDLERRLPPAVTRGIVFCSHIHIAGYSRSTV